MWTIALSIVVIFVFVLVATILFLAFHWFGAANVLSTILVLVAGATTWRKLR